MSVSGGLELLVVLQLVAAGLCLSFALLPDRRTGLSRGWLLAWQVLAVAVLVTNYLLFAGDDRLFDAALYVRGVSLGSVAIVALGLGRSVTGVSPPAWLWALAATAPVLRLVLWPTTDLFVEGRQVSGAPDYGLWQVVTSVPVLVVVAAYIVHALATGARPEERALLTTGFGLEAAILGVSFTLGSPLDELVIGYQSVPAVLALQLLSVRRNRATEAAVRRLGRQRVMFGELARDLQAADDTDHAARVAAHACRDMLEADEVTVAVGPSLVRSVPPDPQRRARSRRGSGDGAPVEVAAVRDPVTVRASRSRAFEENEHRLVETVADVVGATAARIRVQEQLRHRALHDELTGLANRTLLEERLGQALSRVDRVQLPVLVLFADLDGFKDINDEHGHPVGDALLCEVARRLEAVVREGDMVARFGGDEFVVVCEGVALEAVPLVSSRVLAALNGEEVVQGTTLRVRGSIGVAVGRGGDDPHALLRDADTAMYRAKQLGGGRLEVFDASLRSMLLTRIDLERRIPEAVARGELVLHYQPIHQLADGRVSHVEALSRWVRDGRITPPDAWIPAAEHTGAIDEIGAWVVREAGRRLAADGCPPDLGIAVNVSPHQLRHDPGLAKLVAAVEEVPVDAGRIWLEVTESATTDAEGLAALSRLRELGVRVALDDFGTGYSSLSALSRLPVDVVKIDRTFVHRLSDPDGRAVVRAVVQLMNDLARAVVAEGIETEEQLRIAQDLGCTYGQGYLLGRPVDAMPLAPR